MGSDGAGAVRVGAVTVQFMIPRPGVQLAIELLPGLKVTLSWPASATNYVLQTASTLSGNNWQTATNAATLVGGQLQITNSVSGSMFYRLKAGP